MKLDPGLCVTEEIPRCAQSFVGPGAIDEILRAVSLEKGTLEGQLRLDLAQPQRGGTLKSPWYMCAKFGRALGDMDITIYQISRVVCMADTFLEDKYLSFIQQLIGAFRILTIN